MTLKAKLSVKLVTALILLDAILVPVLCAGEDWKRKLEFRRIRVQADLDHLTKYFCAYDQSDPNCQRRLPQLREELRQIDEQLLGHPSEPIRNSVHGVQHRRQQGAGAVALIRMGKFALAEQELLSHLEEVDPTLHEIYDGRIENFDLIVRFASAAKDGELKYMIYKDLLEEIVGGRHDEPLRIIRIIRGLQDEVVQGSSVNDDILLKATNLVDNLKILFETAVSKLWIDSITNKLFESDPNVPKLADEITTLDQNLFTRIISKVIADVYPTLKADHLMRNMEKFHLVPQSIDAYNAIYNELGRHNEINGKTHINKLAYYVKELLHRANSTRIQLTPEKKTQLQLLEQRLPASVRSLAFGERVCLKNKYVHDYLHIAHGHPRLRRYAIMAPGTQLKWKSKPIDQSVYFEFPYGGYLYADDEVSNGRNRLVAASQDSEDMIIGSEWKILPQGDDCHVTNVAFDELLYVSDEFDEEHRSNRVFTARWDTISSQSADRYLWTIEQC